MNRFLLTIASVVLSVSAFLQGNIKADYATPQKIKTRFGLGAGFGMHYGVLGGKFFFQHTFAEIGIGAGIFPLAWHPAVTGSFSFFLIPNEVMVRPKLSAAVSNVASAIYIFDQNDLSSLAKEFYPGYGIYGGVEISKPGSRFGVDINLGYLSPFCGSVRVKDDYDRIIEDLKSRGYQVKSDFGSPSGIRVSIGFEYLF
jgi:hypothetical protein